MAQGQPVQADVIERPQQGAPGNYQPNGTTPFDLRWPALSFPVVAQRVDSFARRVPWWVWVVIGLAVGTGTMSSAGRRVMRFFSSTKE